MSSDPASSHRRVFADNLIALREARGMTQESLGWAAGLHQTEIARIENGRRNPGLDTIIKLARGLDVPAAELFRDL